MIPAYGWIVLGVMMGASPVQSVCVAPAGVELIASDEPAPVGLEADGMDSGAGPAMRLVDGGRAVASFWGRGPDASVTGETEGGAQMPLPGAVRLLQELRPGTLLGAIRVEVPRQDARGSVVAPGYYLLRYVVQPGFKDHFGTSRYRDFVILLEPSVDPGTELDQASALALAAGHPLVLALLPPPPDAHAPVVGCGGRLVVSVATAGRHVWLDLGPR